MRLVRGAALVVLVLAVPVFLIATNARIVIYSGWLYNVGFDKYAIAAETGIDKPQLMRVAGEIKDYFSNDEPSLTTRVVMQRSDRPLYNERELLHMADVKAVIKSLLFLQRLSLTVLLGVGTGTLMALGNRRGLRFVGTAALWGSVGTVGLIALAGLGSLLNFESLFIFFHQLVFTNDLWLLDPRTDYLLMMFPEGFFLDATLCIAGLSLAQAILAGTVAGGYLWRARQAVAASERSQPAGRAPPLI